jgi:hypothetical protein
VADTSHATLVVLSGVIAVTVSGMSVRWAIAAGTATRPTLHPASPSRPSTPARTDAALFTVFSGSDHGVARPRDVAAGPDGNLWFTAAHDRVGRVTPAGRITLFSDRLRGPDQIVAGPDGALWFTALDGRIGRITANGHVTSFVIADDGTSPVGLAAGPDGNLWYTLNDRVGRVTPTGEHTTFHGTPAGVELPMHITAGPDGNLCRRILEPGEVFFEHGAQSDFVYVVDEGEIALVRERPDGSEDGVRLVRPGEYFGELGPLLCLPRSAAARAATAAVVTGYTPQDFKRLTTLPATRQSNPAQHRSPERVPSTARA